MSESGGKIFVYSFIGLGVGVFLFIKGFTWFRMMRLIQNLPTSKIRSLAMGLCEIYGEVVPADKKVLKSPLTNKDCVYYKYSIQEERGSGKHRRWVTIKSGIDRVPFFLKDNTDSVLVDSMGAQIDIPKDFQVYSKTGRNPPAQIMSFLKKNKMSHEGFLGFNKHMCYTEYYIAPKDKLYILGSAGDNPHIEDTTGQKNVDDIMIQKGDEKIYYISDKGEGDVLKKFKWKVIGGFFGGGALIIGCLAIILIMIGIR